MAIELSVILPVMNEGENLRMLLPRMRFLLDRERIGFEIIVVDGGSTDDTREIATALGARLVIERRRGYAGALETGFAEAHGAHLLTLDADMSHEPAFVAKMWRARTRADILIASRYTRGGVAYTSGGRKVLSRLLNIAMRRALSIPVRDVSSGFRLYRREAIAGLKLESQNFEVLEEVLVKAYSAGFSVHEVPFTYFPRDFGRSHARLVRFGLDLSMAKARFLNRRGVPILRGSAFALPFQDHSFDCVISSQVIEHIEQDEALFTEMRRVLEPGGTLIIGTPDYATLSWRVIEPIYGFVSPGGYRDEHVTHYTRTSLSAILQRYGFEHEADSYIAGGELIMRWRKPPPRA